MRVLLGQVVVATTPPVGPDFLDPVRAATDPPGDSDAVGHEYRSVAPAGD